MAPAKTRKVRARRPSGTTGPTTDGYVLTLYVTGATPRSLRAIANLKAICEEYLKGRYTLEVVDIYRQPELLRRDQIVAVPTLIKKLPEPLRLLVGDLSKTGQVLEGLGLVARTHSRGMLLKAKPRRLGVENAALRARLEELEETLRAIRSGEVDALVVETAGEDQVFTLKSADQTYRLMVEEMQKGAATLSDDGVVLYCNPFLAGLLDLPLEAVLGAKLATFVDEPATVSLQGLLKAAEGGVSRGEVSFRRGGGSVPTHVSLTLLPLEGAHVFCMIVTDLTEGRRREAERAQLDHELLAREAAEEANRTAQVEIERRKGIEESLRQAEKERTELLERERLARTEAEEANRLKDEFLATLSHELRSPLNAIVSWSHILSEPGVDPATARKAVQAIDRNARAQTQLIGDILDVSRIVTGKFHLSLGEVRLSEVIEAAVDTVRSAAQARSIQLELAVDPAVGPVLGDEGRLHQVVWNLLSNAIRFAPVGGRVEVRLQEDAAHVQISVMDDGPGIDPAFLPYAFDRFRQADASSTRRHSGLGLGLAIVRHLVDLHGGTVEARNREGQSGALLIVRLPRPQARSERGAPSGRT